MFTSEIPIMEFKHHAQPDNRNLYGKYWYSLNIFYISLVRLIYLR